MSLDFTAVDFETANSRRGSPCSVGLVKVRGGQIVGEWHGLIRPPRVAGRFSQFNVSIHGISERDVATEPGWAERCEQILAVVGDDVLVAHNAGFEVGVLRQACDFEGLPHPRLSFLCSMVVARRALSVPSYSLPFVADELGVPLASHHDALVDARCTALITTRLAHRVGVDSIAELAAAHQVQIGRLAYDFYAGSTYRSSSVWSGAASLVQPETNEGADAAGPLYGKVVTFTGKLAALTRQEAWDLTAAVGGTPAKNTTKATNVLVVGELNPLQLRPGSHISGKARKAFELQDAGQSIEVMTEVDFLRALQGGREDPWEALGGP